MWFVVASVGLVVVVVGAVVDSDVGAVVAVVA